MSVPALGLIWAEGAGGVIGAAGALPWHLPEDLAHFKAVTAGATVIMGRRTWESLPDHARPLPGRRNIVVTRSTGWSEFGSETAKSVEAALDLAVGDRSWVIGGAQLFRAAAAHATVAEVTEVRGRFAGDTYAPRLGDMWSEIDGVYEPGWQESVTGLGYRFRQLQRSTVVAGDAQPA